MPTQYCISFAEKGTFNFSNYLKSELAACTGSRDDFEFLDQVQYNNTIPSLKIIAK